MIGALVPALDPDVDRSRWAPVAHRLLERRALSRQRLGGLRDQGQRGGLDEHEPGQRARMVNRQLQADHGSQVGPDQHHRPDPQRPQQRHRVLSLLLDGGAPVVLRRLAGAVAAPVIGDHPGPIGQPLHDRRPGLGVRRHPVDQKHSRSAPDLAVGQMHPGSGRDGSGHLPTPRVPPAHTKATYRLRSGR